MTMRVLVFLALFLTVLPCAHALTFTWDDESADHAWTNPQNWTNNAGLPGKADTVVFDNTKVGLCRVETNAVVTLLDITNSSGTVEFDVPPGFVLAPITYRQVYNASLDNRVVMSGGGTFAPSGDVQVAYQTASAGSARLSRAELVVSNLVFDSSQLGNLLVSYNAWSIGSMTGKLDLSNATLVWRGNTNMLVTKAIFAVGGTQGTSFGTLLLPGALTNITVGTIFMNGTSQAVGGPNIIDFGTNSAIRTIRSGSDFNARNGLFLYNRSGSTVTGFPDQIDFTVGSSNLPAKLYAGLYYGTYARLAMTNFGSFKAWLSELQVGRVLNNGAQTCFAELDLSENSVTNLEGSITPFSMSITSIVVGGAAGSPTAFLRLPSTLTNIWCTSFDMGSIVGSGLTNCLVTFGTNTQPVAFTVTSNLTLGFADFRSVGPGGMTNLAFPQGSRLRVGSPTSRGTVRLGYIRDSGGSKFLFGKGFSDVTVYADNLFIGLSTGNNGYYHYVTNDFRDATQFVWNVRGDISVGTGKQGEYDYTYLPANGTVSCSNLVAGCTGTVGYLGWRSLLVLSNTTVSASRSVVLQETAVVTNIVNGRSSGFDIGTTNLDIQDPQSNFADYGRMDIRFVADPADVSAPYWGVRMKGDGTGVIQALTETNSTYPARRLTWSTNGLSAKVASRFGVHYDALKNVTYLGVKPLVRGTLLLVQ